MRAIETQFRGYRFRSRLEARWAVFFDSLGLSWDYEPEGFELESGRYLPDFRVVYPGTAAHDAPKAWWFECKPHISLIGDHEWSRMREFDDEQPLIILDGTPDDRLYPRAAEASPADGETDLRDGWALWSKQRRPWHDEAKVWFSSFGGHEDVAHEISGAITVARFTRFDGRQ